MTKINRLFLFIFACIPGAGQMYQGYMKRGLCLITAFSLVFLTAAMSVEYLVVFAMVIWMYSFFDAYDLRRRLLAGNYPEDDYLFRFIFDEKLTELFRMRSRIIGWILVLLGAFALYDNVLMQTLYRLSDVYAWAGTLAMILRRLPDMIAALALIIAGIWLIRGKSVSSDDDITAYGEKE